MNNLQIFNRDVIPVYITSKGNKVVIGRELHERLKISSKYADWFKNMCAYGFTGNKDYSTFSKNLESGGRTIEHILTLNMAKEIAMIQRTPEGRAIRKKLIELDDNISNLSPELREMIHIETEQQRQAKAISVAFESAQAAQKHVDGAIDALAAPVTENWQQATGDKIKHVCKTNGLSYLKAFDALYRELEHRAHVDLKSRVGRRQARMKQAGYTRKERETVTQLYVINCDPALKTAFDGIVRRFAAKYATSNIPC